MKYKIAVVYWTDATIESTEPLTRDEWIKRAKLMTGVSVGHILNETKEHITLAMDYFHGTDIQNETFRIVSTYPKSGIQKIIRQTIEV